MRDLNQHQQQRQELLGRLESLGAGPGGAALWLEAPQPELEGRTPLQAIEEGSADRVYGMLFTLGGL